MLTIVDQLRKWAMEKPEASAFTFLADGETDERRIVFGDLYGSAPHCGALRRGARSRRPDRPANARSAARRHMAQSVHPPW